MQANDRPLLAIGLRAAAMVALSTMFMLIKVLGDRGVAAPELLFWRQVVTVPLVLGWLAATGGLGTLRTRRMGSHAMRAITGTVGLFLNISTAILLPLAEATTLGFSAPLFAVLFTALVLRDRVGPWRWAAVVLGFIGVVIIADPGHEVVSPLGLAAGLGAGLIVSIISFQLRDLGRTEHPVATVFWFSIYGSLIAAVLLPFYYRSHSLEEWGLLMASGVAGTLAQLLLTAALRYAPVATVVVVDYTALIWSTLYGWLLWDRVPGAATWLGAPAIVAAGLIIIWRERHLSRAPTTPLAQEN